MSKLILVFILILGFPLAAFAGTIHTNQDVFLNQPPAKKKNKPLKPGLESSSSMSQGASFSL